MRIDDLRFLRHDTYGCVPVRSSVAAHQAALDGDRAQVCRTTSAEVIAEANITGAFVRLFRHRERREGVLTP